MAKRRSNPTMAEIAAQHTFKIHKSYGEREDLQRLAVCNNINGPITPSGLMTLDDSKVTCKRCLRIIAGKPIGAAEVFNSGTERFEDRVTGRPTRPTGRLIWEKMSYKHYVAKGIHGACLEVVRSGTAKSFNEEWHPVVFGNRWASKRSFKNWTDAAGAAEKIAIEYAQRVLVAFTAVEMS